jgi:hypothetical protein
MITKDDPAAKSEVNLPVFNLDKKLPIKKPVNNMPRASNMELLAAQIKNRF